MRQYLNRSFYIKSDQKQEESAIKSHRQKSLHSKLPPSKVPPLNNKTITLSDTKQDVRFSISRISNLRFSKAKYLKSEQQEQSLKLENTNLSKSSLQQQSNPTIEQYFLSQGFDFAINIHRNAYLPIERFSDDTLETLSDQQVIEMLSKEKISISLMEQSSMGDWFWYRAQLVGYSKLFHYQRKNREGRCARIHFVMDFEDKLLYMKKLQRAFFLRDQMDRYLKFNCYIENMQTNDLVVLSNQQAKQIKERIGFKYPKQWIIRELLEVNQLYLQMQNEIIFVHFLNNSETSPNLKDLLQLFKNPYKKLHYHFSNLITSQKIYSNGILVQQISTSFQLLKQSYLLASICSIKPVQKCLYFVNKQINELLGFDLFIYQQQQFEKFKYSQEQHIKNILSSIKDKWIQDIIIQCEQNLQIVNKISQILNQIQSDRFFQLLRIKLQDALQQFLKSNLEKFMNYIAHHIPADILIQSYQQVQNVYISQQSLIKPLFTILITLKSNEIQYSHNPGGFKEYILGFFDEIYDKISEIPDPETRLVEYFHKEQLYLLNGNLKSPLKEDEYFQQKLRDLEGLNSKVKKSLYEYLKQFESLQTILAEKPFTISKASELILNNREDMKFVHQLPEFMQVGAFLVVINELKEQFLQILQKREQYYIEKLAEYEKNDCIRILNEYSKLEQKIIEKPLNIEQLVDKKDFLENNLHNILQQLHEEVLQVKQHFDLVNTVIESETVVHINFYPIRREDTHKFYRLLMQEQQLIKLSKTHLQSLDTQKKEIFEIQSRDQLQFKKKLKSLSEMINEFLQFFKLEQSELAENQLQIIEQLFTQYQEDAMKFNKREQLFGLASTNYQMILQLQCEFQPYATVWKVNQIWQKQHIKWLNDTFDSVDFSSCEQFFNQDYKQFSQVIDKIQDQPIYPLWKCLKTEIDQFQQYVPVLLALTKNGLRDRHFQFLGNLINIQDESIKSFITLKQLIDLNIHDYMDQCVELGLNAQEEYGIEQVLKNITDTWNSLQFNQIIVKGICIFKKLDQVQALVDDHLIQIEMMFKQKNNNFFLIEITSMYERLKQVSSFLEEWNKAQSSIIYLEPIFESVESIKQLPVEYKKYRQIDKLYKELVGFSNKIFEFGLQDIARVQQINSLLDQIHKELGNYLERKKQKFTRFYFISNEEILEILSNGQDISFIQKYLYKLYESIISVRTNTQTKICALQSRDCELLLTEPIEVCDRNAEEWLCHVEEQMKSNVRQCILNNSQECGNQITMLNLELNHTHRVDSDLKDQKDLRVYQSQLKDRLKHKNQSALNIILLAHHIEVLNRLINYDNELVPFYWSLQMRYYIQGNQCVVNSLQASLQYGYEYQGNIQRIIITPLTERCMIIFMNAVHYKRGGAAVGQTGTGKTETIKDLCKAVGQRCIIFNCSELVDYVLISQLITGLSSSGCWSCFDEFNRITAEVLSVAASKLIEFQPDGMFVSMNPMYKGRNELPDNLKSYFRLASMITPNVSIIISTLLYIYGFSDSNQLTDKLLQLISISQNLLSNQPHYDYSLRAIKSVIVFAGKLQQESDHNENRQQVHLLKALKYVFEPKLLQSDIQIFHELLKQYFPTFEETKIGKQDCCKYIPTSILQEKVDALQLILKIRHGIMIVGPAGMGKSTCMDVVITLQKLTSIRLFPKAVKVSEFFGCLNLGTLEWEEGILPNILKQDQNYQVLIFDGAVETNWIETLNSALDESKRLCLTNGCIINLDCTLMFEVDSLQGATPSTISRCAILYIQDDPLLGVKSSIKEIAPKDQIENYLDIIDKSMSKLLENNISLAQFSSQMINILQVVKKEFCILNIQLFSNCLAWAILPQIDSQTEKLKVNQYLKNIGNIQCENLLIYNEYKEDLNKFQLIHVPSNLKFTCFEDIYVPRLEELAYLKQSLLLLKQHSLLFEGMSGTGKTNLVNQILLNFQYIRVNCSSSTTSSGIQITLEQNLDRRRKGVFGPSVGQSCLIILDDYHMPQDIELTRQFLYQKGWYSKGETQTFLHKVEDTTLLAVMTNQHQHSNRVLRLWTKFTFSNDDQIYQSIFSQIAQIFQMQHHVQKTLQSFRLIKDQLKATPTKIHYQFTMRDVWRVLQSLCNNKTLNDSQWNFEMARVFVDRLATKQDKILAYSIIGVETEQFTEFSAGYNDHSYKAINDLDILLDLMKDQLVKNSIPICEESLKSLIAISRVLGLQQGHLVILGQVGTGGIQLSRLASLISDSECPQIDRWKDDLRNIIKKCINENKKITLLLDELKSSHNQATVFEDLSTLLNSGDLDIFNRKELDDLHQIFMDQLDQTVQNYKKNQKILLHQHYISRLKKNLHCIVSLNSTNKFRNYPSLMSSVTIISLQQLPEQALMSIAQMQLKYIDINSQPLCELFKYFHQSAQLIDSHQKIQTVTSINYQELIIIFKKIYQSKQLELTQKITRYKTGLAKIQTANETITELKQELVEITPQIEKAQKESSIMMEKLKKEKDQAYYQESLLSGDETQANIQQIQATKLATDAIQAVKEVNLLLEQTLSDVSKLKKDHLVEIKSLGKPPKPVVIILTGVVILNLDNLRSLITQPITQLSNQDYFEIAKKHLLNDPKELLELIRNYDKNNINPYNINRLEKIVICEADFTFERAKQCSAAVKYLYSWVKAMYEYNKVYIETKPLREKLFEAQRCLKEKTEILNEKKNQLQIILLKVKNLQEKYDIQISKCEQLNKQLDESTGKLHRAQSMTNGLEQEQQRWTQQIESLQQSQKYLYGDSALAAAYINYCSPLTEQMRNQLISSWTKQAKQKAGFENLPLQFLKQSQSLEVSQNNHIFLQYTNKPIFCIDPQCQANTYIRNTYSTVVVHDLHQFDLAISLKQQILIENINCIPEWLIEYINNNPYPTQQIFVTTMQYNFLMTSQNYAQFYVIDYQITKHNAEELMLEQIVTIQNPELFRQQMELRHMEHENEQKLKQIEESILSILNVQNIKDLLNEETLINQLSSSKKVFNEIQRTQKDYQQIQKDLIQTKQQYKQLSQHISDLYFISQDMQCLDFMYQFSLDWFQQQLSLALSNTKNPKNIFSNFRLRFFLCLCRVLTEQHRLILAFLLAKQTLISVDIEDWQAFIGYQRMKLNEIQIKPSPYKWIDNSNYMRICKELSNLQMVSAKIILNNFEQLQQFFLSKKFVYQDIPHYERLTEIQQIFLTKAIRPDYLIELIKQFISRTLDFNVDQVEQIPLDVSFSESEQNKIILYVLQNNQDPMEQIKEFAVSKNFIKKMWTISLGQGQGNHAEKLMKEAAEQGLWIVIQNCHLHQQWLNQLDQLIMIESHQDYRLWLTSKSIQTFPGRILQKSIKLTYNTNDEKCIEMDEIIKFHYGLLNHCKLGLLGFNKKYQFTQHDLIITQQQCNSISIKDNLKSVVQSYIVSDLHYGGHIVDQLDQITLNRLVCYYFIDKVTIQNSNLTQVYIGEQHASELINNLLYKEFGEIDLVNDQLNKTVTQMSENLPKQIIFDSSTDHKLDAFLNQEILSFNKLLVLMEQSLVLCQRILSGESISNNTSILDDIKCQRVPSKWNDFGFKTDKSLSFWFSELLQRYSFLSNWNTKGIPSAINLGHLMNPKNFLVYAKFTENCLQKQTIFTILDSIQLDHITSPPQTGYYIYGITIQGAKWSQQQHQLVESTTMLTEFPICYLHYKEEDEYQLFYRCPVYQLMDRQEMITFLPIPCDNNRDWILSGVAAFININI